MAKTSLYVQLLGRPEIWINEQRLTTLGPAKADALFYYLAATKRIHARQNLAMMLWPDNDSGVARRYLRRHLVTVRHHVGDYMNIVDDLLGLNLPTDDMVDIHQLIASTKRHTAHQALPDPELLTHYRHAVTLYQGEFLADFDLPETPDFSDWVAEMREEMRMKVATLLYRLSDAMVLQRNQTQAHDDLDRLLALVPWHEEGHRLKMRLLYESGQRWAALEQYAMLQKMLEQELDVPPDEETERLVEQIRAGESTPDKQEGPPTKQSATFSEPTASSPAKKHHAPSSVLPLYGREEFLSTAQYYLQTATYRLITLVGMGGAGKSHIALTLAQLVEEHFAHGVCFVPLAGVQPTTETFGADDRHRALDKETQRVMMDALCIAIANTLRLPCPPDAQQVDVVMDYLATHPLLLILDNFEHLLPAAALLVRLLQNAPDLVILVTSRVRLNLMDEAVLIVESLSTPAEEEEEEITPLWRDVWLAEWAHSAQSGQRATINPDISASQPQTLPYPCLQFFIDCAKRQHPDFVATQTNLPYIIKICQLVDGLPLAIELAAQWIGHLRCEEIFEQLTHDLALLQNDITYLSADADVLRHQSMEVVFAHSWQMLPTQAQKVLAQCSLFVGNFSQKAVSAITKSNIMVLKRLTDHSLLSLHEQGRYGLHFLTRQWVHTQIIQEDTPLDLNQFWSAYCAYYLRLMMNEADRLNGEDAPLALATLRREFENIRQAWQQAVQRRYFHLIQETLDAVVDAYGCMGLYQEGLDMVYALQQNLGDANERTQAPFTQSSSILYQQLQGRSQIVEAKIYFEMGDYVMAQRKAMDALAMDHNSPRGVDEIRCHLILGMALTRLGSADEAIKHTQQALTQIEQHPIPLHQVATLQADTYFLLANMALYQNNFEQADRYSQAAMSCYQQIGHQHGVAHVLRFWAKCAEVQEEFEPAQRYMYDALKIHQKLQMSEDVVNTLDSLGRLCLRQGRITESIQYQEASFALLTEMGLRMQTSDVYTSLGILYVMVGQLEKATTYLEKAIEFFEKAQDINNMCYTYCYLSAINIWSHNVDSALDFAEQALRLVDKMNQADGMTIVYGYIGDAWIASGDYQKAAEFFQKGLDKAIELNQPHLELGVYTGLAKVSLHLEDVDGVRQSMEAVWSRLDLTSLQCARLDYFYPAWICYQLMQAMNDPRQSTLLTALVEQLMAWADQIEDVDMRQSALTHVPVNRAILMEWERVKGEK
ncbi:MAG: tetratricopeptide repeat protein [Chloroflexota bacterium]